MKKIFQYNRDDLPIVMVTAYDAITANIAYNAEVDIILVGDSMATTILAYNSVRDVSVSDICHHTSAVRRGAPTQYIIADLPWEAVQNIDTVVKSAKEIIASGANSVKLEVEADKEPLLKALEDADIPVCAHIGYTPQTPGLEVTAQGRDKERALELVHLADLSQKYSSFMIVLELVPQELAEFITDRLTIPTIGIGAGPYCSGQVQVIYDITGFSDKIYRHAKIFDNSGATFTNAIREYKREVTNSNFPTEKNCAKLSLEFIKEIEREL